MVDSARLTYRPALDGVRAVAVLAVIGYHAGSSLPGGFLGVDVFFVLSGYLITRLLLEERTNAGRIFVPGFWARRARRLLPALLLLLVVVAVYTASSAPASTLLARRSDMLSTLFYYANWHFLASAQSYFATFAGVSPLRHTWSLAIEEQFYLVWPLLLVAVMFVVRSWRRVLPWLIVAGAVVSGALMATQYRASDPARAYYGTDARVHALLVGAALGAVVQLHPAALTAARARLAAAWIAPVAAAAVLVAFLTFRGQDAFYYRGGSLLFAVIVAAGLWAVEARPRLLPAALLSVAPLVWIGQISYGLYLWHWPLITWIGNSQRFAGWTGRQRQALEIGLTFVIAAASFYLLERPIRYGTFPWLRRSGKRLAIVAPVCVALVAVLAVGATTISSSSIASQVTDTSDSTCPPESDFLGDKYAWCSRTEPATPDATVVAVAGDSTSRALDPGMVETASKRGWRYIQAGQGGCSVLPLVLVSPYLEDASEIATAVEDRRDCAKYVPVLLSQVTSTYDPDVWIVSDAIAEDVLVQSDGDLLSPGNARRDGIMIARLRATLRTLTSHGAHVVLLAAVPAGAPAECADDERPASCRDPKYSVKDKLAAVFNKIARKAMVGVQNVVYISITDVLCRDDGSCPAAIDGMLVRFDGLHYTSRFSRKIVPVIVARAERAGVPFT